MLPGYLAQYTACRIVTTWICRVFVTTIVLGLFLMLIVGTFNYLGYDESVDPSQDSDKGKGRGLAEEIQQQVGQGIAASEQTESNDSHQDQTHQLQACDPFFSCYLSLAYAVLSVQVETLCLTGHICRCGQSERVVFFCVNDLQNAWKSTYSTSCICRHRV